MKSTEGRVGRAFILRLEDGDVVPQCIEKFALENGIKTAQVTLLGGLGKGDIVSGPRIAPGKPPNPMLIPIDGVHEVAAVGVIALGKDGKPELHIHGALGRAGKTITGCLRPGVETWVIGEAAIIEIVGADAKRATDKKTGFTLLGVGNK